MTISFLARSARTGQFGLAVASYSIAIGAHTDGAVRPGIGVTFTQAHPLARNNRLVLNVLAQGFGAPAALREVLANDPHSDWRQIGVIDREGTVAAHDGPRCHRAAAHRAGAGWIALGESIAGESVLAAMAQAFERDADAEFDARLLAALEAGRDAGGLAGRNGRLPERSAALVVWGVHDYNDIDLRVDLHPHAVAELRRIYADYKPTAAFYDERARNPRAAVSAMTFAETLRGAQGKRS